MEFLGTETDHDSTGRNIRIKEINMDFFAGKQFAAGYELKGAILIYQKAERMYCDEPECICTFNRFENGKLDNGEAVDFAEIMRIIRCRETEHKLPKILPENLICCDGTTLCWWKKEQKAKIFFKNTRLNHLSGKTILYPKLLFIAEEGELSVFCITENRFNEKTQLYIAPFFNVFSSGKLCLPENAKVGTRVEDIPGNEALFFESYFSHPNGENSFCPGGLYELMERLCKGESIRKEWLKGAGTLGMHLNGGEK